MMDLLLAAASGTMLVMVFPKFNLFLLAYVALVPLLYAIRKARSVYESAFFGFLCGLIFFGGVLFWINTLSRWAGNWAYLAWAALAIFQALFIAAFAAMYKYGHLKAPSYSIITAPLLWAMVEWIRSMGPYGITGGGLSYSQVNILQVLQIAAVVGSYGISFLIVLVNEALTEALADRQFKGLNICLVVMMLALIFGSYRVSSFRETGKPVKLAVIQANISQDKKLDFGAAYEITDAHEEMSRKALQYSPDVIVWPETAVTTYLFESRSIISSVKDLIKKGKPCYLIGTPYRDKDKIYNSVAAFSNDGNIIGRYDKQRLVPFGEYLPLRPLLYRMLQENPLFAEDYNGNPDPKIIDIGIAKAGIVICFESTFPNIVRDKVKKGAQFLLIATNDAWFFDSAALYQHIQAAQMRAVENNVYVVQAANTGISAVISPIGRIVKSSGIEEPTVLLGTVYVH